MKAEWNDTPQCLTAVIANQRETPKPTRQPLLSAEAIDSQPVYAKKPLTRARRRGVIQIVRQDKQNIYYQNRNNSESKEF